MVGHGVVTRNSPARTLYHVTLNLNRYPTLFTVADNKGRQCIDEVLQEGRTLEELYEAQGISMGALSGNSSEDMYDE